MNRVRTTETSGNRIETVHRTSGGTIVKNALGCVAEKFGRNCCDKSVGGGRERCVVGLWTKTRGMRITRSNRPGMGGIAVENEVFGSFVGAFLLFRRNPIFPVSIYFAVRRRRQTWENAYLGSRAPEKFHRIRVELSLLATRARAERNKNKLISRRRRNRRDGQVGGRGRLNRTINARGNVIGGGGFPLHGLLRRANKIPSWGLWEIIAVRLF